jgi:Na+/proline symporter
MNSDGTGYLAQRSIACRSDKDARVAAITFTWLQILLRSLIWLIIGIGLLVIYPFETSAVSDPAFAAGREMTFVTGINDLLPVGVKGIMLTGLLGALASTIDTHLNWGASYWSNDIYADLVCRKWLKREGNSRELVWVARLSNIIILVIAVIIMLNLGSIQQAWVISLLFGAGMGSVLIMLWLWERINLFSEISAIVASLITAPILLTTVQDEWLQLLLMAVVTTTVAIGVTFLTPKTTQDTLQNFYKIVKPQGFWRKTATSLGDDPSTPSKKLSFSLRDTLITCMSLYALLIGLGKLMFRSSGEPIWIPIIFLIVGLALVPAWYKAVVKG